MNAAAAPKTMLAGLKSLGPYLLIELILPGGTLIALILWLSQGMTRSTRGGVHKPASLWPSAIGRAIAARRDIRARHCCGGTTLVGRVLQRARGLFTSRCDCDVLQCAR